MSDQTFDMLQGSFDRLQRLRVWRCLTFFCVFKVFRLEYDFRLPLFRLNKLLTWTTDFVSLSDPSNLTNVEHKWDGYYAGIFSCLPSISSIFVFGSALCDFHCCFPELFLAFDLGKFSSFGDSIVLTNTEEISIVDAECLEVIRV